MKKIMSLLLVAVMVVLLIPSSVMASTDTRWVNKGNNTWELNDGAGNVVTAKIDGYKLYISGNGAVPAYSQLYLRPWNDKVITELYIDNGITSIGNKAFADMNTLAKVEMYASTFIEQPRAFKDAYNDAIFYIKGMNIVNGGTDRVPYTSIDSIAYFVNTYAKEYRFVFDNWYMINMVKNGYTTEYYKSLAPKDALTKEYNEKYPYIKLTTKITTTGGYGLAANAYIARPGVECRKAFEAFLGDYNYAYAVDIVASRYYKTVNKLDAPTTFTLTIPNAYLLEGRTFKVLQIAPGIVNVLDDIDTVGNTITFATDYPTTTYAIIYK